MLRTAPKGGMKQICLWKFYEASWILPTPYHGIRMPFRNFLPEAKCTNTQCPAFPEGNLFYRTARLRSSLSSCSPLSTHFIRRFTGRLVNKNSRRVRERDAKSPGPRSSSSSSAVCKHGGWGSDMRCWKGRLPCISCGFRRRRRNKRDYEEDSGGFGEFESQPRDHP